MNNQPINKIKPGASVFNLRAEMAIAYIIACGVYNFYGYECVMTCGTDSKHSKGSKHPLGYAIDLRTNHLHPEEVQKVADRLREALGPEFDVIVEATHIHVEHDPKFSGITYLS